MQNKYIDKLLDFLNSSPTAFHAVDYVKEELLANDFEELNPENKWQLQKGKKYFLTRNGSALIAFIPGKDFLKEGIRIVSSHTDSPALKIKPDPVIKSEGYYTLNTEIYGAPILNTWYDRPLSIAGKVVRKGESAFKNQIELVDFQRNLAVIANLAIHLNKEVNEKSSVDKKKGLRALISSLNINNNSGAREDDEKEKEKHADFNKELSLENILEAEFGFSEDEILDQDLFLYSTQKAELTGLEDEFITAGKQDNLSMAHASFQSILEAEAKPWSQMVILYDNEEIGSNTPQGADSPFAGDVIERIISNLGGDREDYYSIVEKSILLSADMAHAVHPNFSEVHDKNNRPKLNKGPVLKYNASQNYTTHSETAAVVINLMEKHDIPYQNYTNRSDKKGGSTIGPIAATQLGIESLDVGSPLLAMHSIQELGGARDHYNMIRLMKAFLNDK